MAEINSIWISGIPAAGKSFLADKLSRKYGIKHYDLDELREELVICPDLKPWVNFFLDQDEKTYWENTGKDEHWHNLVSQSEALWPIIKNKIETTVATDNPAIFECVNILPHLATRDLTFPGVVLLSDSVSIIFERNKKNPRWGNTEDLQQTEAVRFMEEGEYYRKEAEKYGIPVFTCCDEAEKYLDQKIHSWPK